MVVLRGKRTKKLIMVEIFCLKLALMDIGMAMVVVKKKQQHSV